MAENVKISIIGALDMLKFKKMSDVREKAIQAAPAKEITCDLKINNNAGALHPDFIPVVVKDIIEHGEGAPKTFVFSKEDGTPLPYFRAGQYLSVKLHIGESYLSRPYSISSSPRWALEGKYAITVHPNPGGFAARWMHENVKVGDRLTISSPLGDYYYEPLRDSNNVVALAGGIGITPFLSMAYALRDGIEDFNLTILFGNATEEGILYRRELDEIAAACDKVKVVHVLSDEDKEGFEHGFITADVIRKHAPEEYTLFVCGPEPMYRFLQGELPKLNIPERLYRSEAQGVTVRVEEDPLFPESAKGKTFTITVKQGPNTRSVPAASHEPVLVALERAGIRAPSRCRRGECGWCRSRMTQGEIFAPEANEGRRWADVQFGYIHPCSSFPVSDLTLEVPGEYVGE